MQETTKFRIQAGALILEIEGPTDFVKEQMKARQAEIDEIIKEQSRIIKSGKIPMEKAGRGRRGRPPKKAGVSMRSSTGRRPGRQPVIVRDSSLTLGPRQLSQLSAHLESLTTGSTLSKDATVFGIAYFLCKNVLKSDNFSAGDVIAAYEQLGSKKFLPASATVVVVQMLRNLAAASIGKEWVARNSDGTFSLTSKGSKIGESGKVVRPRGRKPAKKAAAAKAEPKRRGRPPKSESKASAAAPKKAGRKRGRPRKS